MKTQTSLLNTDTRKDGPVGSTCAVRDQRETEGSIFTSIAQQPFFAGFKPSHLQILSDSAMRTQFHMGQQILEKGDPANRFYVILKGRVSLETADEYGRVHQVHELSPGDALGWSWAFPPYYWHFDAYAKEPTEAIFFYGTRLREVCEWNHDFGYELMKRMAEVVIGRLQATRKHWIEERSAM
jgi:CRP/FNR family cyclic AMP-dependent transcriptional regulator